MSFTDETAKEALHQAVSALNLFAHQGRKVDVVWKRISTGAVNVTSVYELRSADPAKAIGALKDMNWEHAASGEIIVRARVAEADFGNLW